MPGSTTPRYRGHVGHFYKFKRGDRVKIVSGKYAGNVGTVDSCVFQRSVDYPDEYGAAYHVILDDEDGRRVITVRVEQVEQYVANDVPLTPNYSSRHPTSSRALASTRLRHAELSEVL